MRVVKQTAKKDLNQNTVKPPVKKSASVQRHDSLNWDDVVEANKSCLAVETVDRIMKSYSPKLPGKQFFPDQPSRASAADDTKADVTSRRSDVMSATSTGGGVSDVSSKRADVTQAAGGDAHDMSPRCSSEYYEGYDSLRILDRDRLRHHGAGSVGDAPRAARTPSPTLKPASQVQNITKPRLDFGVKLKTRFGNILHPIGGF